MLGLDNSFFTYIVDLDHMAFSQDSHCSLSILQLGRIMIFQQGQPEDQHGIGLKILLQNMWIMQIGS